MEEFLMLILEEQGPDDMLFQKDGAPPHFHKEVTDFSNCKFQEKYIGGAGLSLGHLVPLIFLFWGYIKDGYQFAGTCWEDERCSGYTYPRLA
jgi:hypothetical protein